MFYDDLQDDEDMFTVATRRSDFDDPSLTPEEREIADFLARAPDYLVRAVGFTMTGEDPTAIEHFVLPTIEQRHTQLEALERLMI